MRLLIEAANGVVAIANGEIVAARGRFDVVLRVPNGLLRPGLINAHDHLHRNHYGRLGAPPYANAVEWGRDIHERERARIAAGRALPRRIALLRGAWKNLFAGVTTVVHHDRWEPDFDAGFPVRVHRVRWAHRIGLDPPIASDLGAAPFAIHVAEGVDAAAADEVRELDQRGLLGPRLLAVHAVGVDDDGIRRLRSADATVVICPTSNEFLFGRTPPRALLADGIAVLVGSDSLLTGAGSLLDELRRTRALGLISDARLEDAVGRNAAARLGLPEPTLEEGAPADVIVLRRPLLAAREPDVAVVVARGVLRVLDPALTPALGKYAEHGRMSYARGTVRWIDDRRASLAGPRRSNRVPAGASE